MSAVRRAAAVAAAVAVVVPALLAGCSGDDETPPSRGAPSQQALPGRDPVLPAPVVEKVVAQVPELTLAPLPDLRLADGLTPPTNRWFSGLVFGAEPQPVFPLPLAFGMDETSFGVGLPQIVTSASAIVGSHQQDVTFEVADAATNVVSSYDVASATVETRDGDGEALGHTTVAEGWPFVSHVAARDETLTSSVAFTGSGDLLLAEVSGREWGLRLGGATVDGDTISLRQGDSIVLFPVPDDSEVEQLAAHAVPLSGTGVTFEVGADTVTTDLTYETEGDDTPAYAALPHHSADLGDGCDLGTLPTVYGASTVCAGSTLRWSAPRQQALGALDLSVISDDERQELADQVASDIETLPDPPADTYFGGKWTYRTAQLMEIARQVGAEAAADEAGSRLEEVLGRWTEPEGCEERAEFCFGYDPAWRGVVGQAVAFGSELFNDHHFHYGYFLYAAGVLAADDPELVRQLEPVMTLLAADIASGSDTGLTPQWRPFDVYASHSWAAGTADFADGNNQESSSEAVTAWAGLQLWARAAGDQDLERQAAWMQALEAQAATAYWTSFDTGDPVYDGFDHGVMGINWGGKRDYATWFSPEPSAILGIQLVPMSPSSGYLAGRPDRIRANVEEAGSGPLADYALMYAGLAGRADAQDALDRARRLPDDAIDQGNSRSYLMAYLMALAARD